jgi:hypothetical protein
MAYRSYQNRWKAATNTNAYRKVPPIQTSRWSIREIRMRRQQRILECNLSFIDNRLLAPGSPATPPARHWLYFFVKMTRSKTSHCSNYGWRGPIPVCLNPTFPFDLAPFLPQGPDALLCAGQVIVWMGMADLDTGGLWESGPWTATDA